MPLSCLFNKACKRASTAGGNSDIIKSDSSVNWITILLSETFKVLETLKVYPRIQVLNWLSNGLSYVPRTTFDKVGALGDDFVLGVGWVDCGAG